jgi:acyl-CoA reductase-like NAD-dependent aldehyde dehydrogenase
MPRSRTGSEGGGSSDSDVPVSDTSVIVNPATEKALAQVPRCSEEEVDAAVSRAVAAQRAWSTTPPAERARLLRAFADAVDGAGEELAQLEVENAGHTLTNARSEAAQVRDVLFYFSGAPERLFGRQIPVPGGVDVTFKEPIGVVGVIVPWNFPMTIASWGIAPALAAGNAVVMKPAELTPLTAMRLGRLASDAGIPEGVMQVVTGQGAVAGRRLVSHPQVNKIVFTGSTDVGKEVMASCASQVKRVTLELGGKSANIVFEDCDIERAALTAPFGVFDNAGQDCCARSRILVQRSVFERFMELFEPAVKGVLVGDPREESSQMGPLISASHRERVDSYVRADVPVAFRGDAPPGPGFWYPATVLAPLPPGTVQFEEEIFGPVVGVTPFEDEAHAVELANATSYGLSGSIWTSDVGRAWRVARGVQSGNLSVNSHSSVRYSTPFGGFKQSGLGRELGPDATDAFSEVKNVFIATEV